MAYETILYDVQDSVATITLNRPEMRNALTTVMYKELAHAFKTVSRDKAVRAVVLTGAGKGFCSGQDLAEMGQVIGEDVSVTDVLRNGLNPLIQAVRDLPKPVIGALNVVEQKESSTSESPTCKCVRTRHCLAYWPSRVLVKHS